MPAIVYAVYANREHIFSHQTKIASITGIAQPATIIIKRIWSVKFPIRIAGIARTKHVARLMTSARRVSTPGTATDVKQNMLWTRLGPTATCIVRTRAVKKF